MNLSRKIRLLVVDDSAVVRRMICDAVANDSEIEVVGTAPDPYIAREKILELNPDVLTLDIEMPKMDGLTFLKILREHRPIPVIIISSLTQAGSRIAMEALEAGAVEVLAKPTSAYSVGNLSEQLAMRVKAAAMSGTRSFRSVGAFAASPAPVAVRTGGYHPRQLIVLGSSTGGTEALKQVLTQLPAGLPPIAIAQHIPAYFSRAFAERMNDICQFEVREAADGDELHPGLALVAPGDFHLSVVWTGQGYRAALNQKSPVHHCRPAVDVLFRSAAQCGGARVVAGILTGMGSDGALGMQALKAIGARTMAQNEATCVVYGMPRAAVELGVVDQVLPLSQIAPAILEATNLMAGAREPSPAMKPAIASTT
ncbi:protein-glutamate methylesterase/protein-glutamine glutaminase [Horticoccus sp. 23ND18S-11]|uniref:protein-glutamate methylesterase/protein-glutamine glutaminase n=1 Tax=Horticoccus sp. 23ND18S-11 TaxID=3391832 RepID=UPI0039C948AD